MQVVDTFSMLLPVTAKKTGSHWSLNVLSMHAIGL